MRSETLTNLGVILSYDATFNELIENVVIKVRQETVLFLRTFYCRRMNIMKTLFKSLIVLHVEYCSELWMPIEPTQIQTIENLQKYLLQNTPETSLLRRLQAQTLPDATPPIGSVDQFSKSAVTFELIMQF